MARQPLTAGQKRYQRRQHIIGWGAALLFAIGVFAVTPLLKDLLPDRPPRLDDMLALIAAFMMLQMALVMTIAHSAAPKDAAMPRRRFSQVLSVLIGGVTLLLPILGQRFIDPALNFAIVIALTAASLVITWLIWRAADELMRAMIKDGYAANYLVVVTALCVYATGERLGLLSGVTAWGALGFATITSVFCSMWVIMRRGAHRPPLDE